MKTCARAILSIASVFLLVTSCQRILPPTVELTGVRFGGIGMRGATLIADVEVENPNDFTIQTDSITFQFEAANPDREGTWSPVTSGASRERLRIEGGRTVPVEIPIEFAYSDLSGPIRSVFDKGTLNYRISGKVLVREPRRTNASYSKTGTLSLVRNP